MLYSQLTWPVIPVINAIFLSTIRQAMTKNWYEIIRAKD